MAATPFGTTIPRGATSFYDFSQNDDGGQPGATTAHEDEGSDTPATPPLATPTLNGNNGSSSSSSSTTTTSSPTGEKEIKSKPYTNPYETFNGTTLGDVEDFLKGRIEYYKSLEESEEDRLKREKREKHVGFLASLAEGLGTFHTAFSHARGVKAMDMPKMSAKAQELFEKAKAQRDKNNDRLVNLAITLANIQDKDRDFNLRVTQAEQQQNNWQQQFDAGRQDRADDVAFRDKQFDAGRKDRADDVAFRDKQLDENRRQFNVTSAEQRRHNRAAEGLQAAGIAETKRHNQASEDGKYTEFYSGNGMVRIPNTRLNQHNLSYIYQQIKVPVTDKGKPTGEYTTLPLTTTDSRGNLIPVSAEQMMQEIGAHIDDKNVQSALRAIGGEQVSKKKPLPGSETNGKKPLP